GARRKKQAAKLSAEAKNVRGSVRKTLKRVRAVIADLMPKNGNVRNGDRVSADATANAVRLATQLGAPARLTRDNLHPYRLKIKELQNTLRLAAGSPRPRLLGDLAE